MARVIDPDRPIIVTRHAIEQYRRRRFDQRPYAVIDAEIRECVETALEEGMVYDRRPEGFVLYGRKKKSAGKLPPGQRFVRCNKDADYGFILKRTTDEGDIVMTTLTRVGVR